MEVKSSHIRSVEYDPNAQTMRVTFRNGSSYEYSGVSADVHRQMVGAKSVGRHFHRFIRGRHTERKL